MGSLKNLLFALLCIIPMLLSASPADQPLTWIHPVVPIHVSSPNCKSSDGIDMLPIDGWGQAYQIVPDCRAPSTRSMDNVFHLFLDAWTANYGDLEKIVENNMKDTIVVWSRDRRYATGYRENGEFFENLEVVGLTSNKSFIWVSLKPSRGKICNSSLVHELVHASIWALNINHGDPDHLGPIYGGWDESHSKLINDLDKKICMMGL
jgi:hypothetical protein